MRTLYSCITDQHDHRLLMLAGIICVIGVYGASAIAAHAGRQHDQLRKVWSAIAIVAAGCTAWASHMIGMLAFEPSMQIGFKPVLMILALGAGVLGIGAGMAAAVGRRDRARRFSAGLILGLGIVALHYLGQASFIIPGRLEWNWLLIATSIAESLVIFGCALVLSGEKNKLLRAAAAPMIVAAIAFLHFNGMAAATLVYDPLYVLPPGLLSVESTATIVAAVSIGLLTLALVGLRFALAARTARRRDRERMHDLAGLAVEGLAVCDKGVIALANDSLNSVSCAKNASLVGRPIALLLPGVDIDSIPIGEERDTSLAALDGQLVPVRVLRRSVMLGGVPHTLVAVRDQRERLQTEERVRALAFSDRLTGLANRTRFTDLFSTHIANAAADGRGVAVLLINIHRFRMVNAFFGHHVGDALLKMTAARLQSLVSDRDVIARLGNDEFAILQVRSSAGDGNALTATILSALAEPFAIADHSLTVSFSIGLAIAPPGAQSPDTVLSNAGLALANARRDGKSGWCAYEESLGDVLRRRQRLEADLRVAIEAGELDVYYQPLVQTCTSKISGAEALVRWHHKAFGAISPVEFIPIAEEAGLIGTLGRHVLRLACEQAALWPDHMRIAVNLSPLQFSDPGMVAFIAATLATTGLAPERLDLEITEGVFLLHEEQTLAALSTLRDLGVGLSMDDFGTGYSSLSYLRRYPFTKIKIDRSFIRDLSGSDESASILRAIFALARALGLSTVMEGVEEPGQFAFALLERCDQVQGFLISRAVPAKEFQTLIRADRAAA